ncbi:MAG: AmmeMemoRadiSam system protein B, partial [Planctomycetota bacterium]|nr:AmmeMemoRadiSam system protein B [Planctomycetota bacterium]
KTDVSQLIALTQGLDQIGLLWGPTFERLEAKTLQRIKESGSFPTNASASLGTDETMVRETIKGYLDQTEDPELEMTVRGIVAPHLDYERGWPNYAAAYYNLQHQAKPDRVVILGTNHFGLGDGVVFTESGFQSPLGICPIDQPVADHVLKELGRPVIIDQLDFMAEHSIELHLPWIQYAYGNVPILAALIPDPLHSMIEDDEENELVTTEVFLNVLTGALEQAGGSTLFVSSADLSHVGPQFGEPRAVDEQRRFDVERHDRDMMGKFLTGDGEQFLEAMNWNRNPTRWCSIGNMAALLELIQPDQVELIDYRQAVDEQGRCMVTSAAMAMG